MYIYNIFYINFVPYNMNDTIILLELCERMGGGVQGLCDMVSVNINISTLAYIDAIRTQYV